MTKPLQNYIEEEIKRLENIIPLIDDKAKNDVSQSLHRIAEITAREIVPDHIQSGMMVSYDYLMSKKDLQDKIKEFIG